MISVGHVVLSRNFAQPNGFTVYRKSGHWERGRWIASETAIKMTGTVTVANPEELVQVPEADRVKGVMCFYSTQPIYRTRFGDDTDPGGTSDEIEWHGERYRVAALAPWSDFGYYKAFGVRMDGA